MAKESYQDLMKTSEFAENLAVGRAQELVARHNPDRVFQGADDFSMSTFARKMWEAGFQVDFVLKPINPEEKK